MTSRKSESILLYQQNEISDVDELLRDERRCCTKGRAVFTAVVLLLIVAAMTVLGVLKPWQSDDDQPSSQYISQETRDGAAQLITMALSDTTVVYNRIATVTDTFGPRFSGTQALEDAITYIEAQVQADKLTVAEEGPVYVPRWVRGNEYARMTQPRNKTLHMIGLGMSNATRVNGAIAPIEAEVVVVTSFDDLDEKAAQGLVEGKIVLYNVPFTTYSETVQYRSNGALRAEAYGAVGVLVRSVAPFGIQTPHTGGTKTAGIAAAAISIEDASQIQRMVWRGTTVRVELYMEAQQYSDTESRNLVITIPGTDFPHEYVVIGGHVDSWDNSEGAMDDLSGAFICWEAARLISLLSYKPRRTIRVVFFTNEENGARGGEYFATYHSADLAKTSIAIEVDMGVFSPYALSFTGSSQALSILKELGTLIQGIGGGVVITGGGGTDIDPMCEKGVPCAALQVIDPRAEPDSNNPCLMAGGQLFPAPTPSSAIRAGYFWYHHTSGDTIDKLSGAELQESAAALAVWTYAIANLDTILPRN